MEIPYTGQNMNDLLKIFIKEATGNEDIHKSTHNPYIYDTLIKSKKEKNPPRYFSKSRYNRSKFISRRYF